MKKMEEKIRAEGVITEGRVLNVGIFLNQQIDTAFLKDIGAEIARLFKHSGATKILTIETSGIAVAVAAGMAMDLPVVFAKKSKKSSVKGDQACVIGNAFWIPRPRKSTPAARSSPISVCLRISSPSRRWAWTWEC